MALRGNIERAERDFLQGWIRDDSDPQTPVSLLVSVDDRLASRVLANVYRQDLEQAGIGNGRHGFAVVLDGLSPLTAHTLRITREDDGAEIPGSPRVIPPALELDEDLMNRLAAMLADAPDDDALTQRAAYLAHQADRLLQIRADRRSNRTSKMAQRHFRVRWSGRGDTPDMDPAPRALIIDDTLPDPKRDAGSCAIVSHMQSLQRLGFAVTFAPANNHGGPGVRRLEQDGIACCCAPWSGSVEEVLRREQGSFALVYIHRGGNTRYMPLVRHHQPRARVVYSVADLHHLRLARQAEVEQRPELTEASQRVRAAELSAARFADSVITHSSFEAALLKRDLPNSRIHVIPWTVVPTPISVDFADRRGIALIGSYTHAPNLDAAWWMIQDVMPIVRKLDPSIECRLVGSGIPDGLATVVAPGITVVGHVDDLSTVLARIRLTVAPLTFGAGIKGKVIDSMAAGLPCVCTPIAAEGLDLPPLLQSIVADGPQALAEAIVRVHNDPQLNHACAEAGLAYVEQTLSEARIDALMREAAGVRAA